MTSRNNTQKRSINYDETPEARDARIRDFFAVPLEEPKIKKRVGPRWHEIRDLLMDSRVPDPDRHRHDPGEIDPYDDDEDTLYHATLRARLDAIAAHKQHLSTFEAIISDHPREVVEDLTCWFNHLINRLGEDGLIPRLLDAVSISPFRDDVRTKVIRSTDYRKLVPLYREACRLAWIARRNLYIQRDLYGSHEFDRLAGLNTFLAPRLGVAFDPGPTQHPLIQNTLAIMCKVTRTSSKALANDRERKREARASGKVTDKTAAERQRRYRARNASRAAGEST